MKTAKIMLGQVEVELAMPSSYALRTDIWMLDSTNPNRAYAAALGVCVVRPSTVRPERKYSECRNDPALFGGLYMDQLREAGHHIPDIIRAGVEAYRFMTTGLITQAEVDAELGNSDAHSTD